MFKLYMKSQQAQLDWIRKHPGQWIALNGVLITVFVGYIAYQDRKLTREMQNEDTQQDD